MSVAAIGQLGTVAPPTTGAAGTETDPLVAAARRIQQLQTLIAQVERRAPSSSFGAALQAAQTAGVEADTAQPSVPSAQPAVTMAQPAIDTAATALATGQPATYTGQPATYTEQPATTTTTPPAATGAGASPAGDAYVPMIEQAAARNGLQPSLLYGLIEQESDFDPSAQSGAGAEGLTQLMPSTAASLGVADPLNPAEAIEGGARFLGEQLRRFGGNTADALAAYNAGPGAVQQYGGVPPYAETQQYVSKVLGYAAAYNEAHGQPVAGTVPA